MVHFSLAEHILETCEDDTKSMFSLVQVCQLGSNIVCPELLGKGGGRREGGEGGGRRGEEGGGELQVYAAIVKTECSAKMQCFHRHRVDMTSHLITLFHVLLELASPSHPV